VICNSIQVVLATSGKAALNTLQAVTPQLFLLDDCLPDMNGLELVERIRSMQVYEQTPILFMSGSLTKGNIAEEHLICLHKPFGLNNLIKLIEEYLVV
jgi:CheY-like chemotaxis protein